MLGFLTNCLLMIPGLARNCCSKRLANEGNVLKNIFLFKVGVVLKNYFVNSFSSSLGLKTGKNNPWPEENGLHGFMLRLGLLSVDCTVALFHVVQQLFWLQLRLNQQAAIFKKGYTTK